MRNILVFIKENLAVGLLLFALFLGAGNIIFPPLLGQQAGEHITTAMVGFLITGVGLPLLAIVAVAKAGGDLQLLASRVHPIFGIIFTSIVYLAIGRSSLFHVQALCHMKSALCHFFQRQHKNIGLHYSLHL
ncbi:hypothetical protein LSPH24S_04440 [Lysinibacillus sphaericus]